eukprot:268922_1
MESFYNQRYHAMCNKHIKSCLYFNNLQKMMRIYQQNIGTQHIDEFLDHSIIYIVDLLNAHQHLLFNHSKNNQLDYIHKLLDRCCVTHKCPAIYRSYKQRKQQLICQNASFVIWYIQQIFDQIHCYYYHAYDVGPRLTAVEKQNILESQYDNEQLSHYLKLKSILQQRQLLCNQMINTKHERFVSNLYQTPIKTFTSNQKSIITYCNSYFFNYLDRCNNLHQS